MNPVGFKWPTKGWLTPETKLVSVLLPPNPMLPRESNSKIEIEVAPRFDPRKMGYRLAKQLWGLFLLASIAEKVSWSHMLGAIVVRELAWAISFILN